MFVIVIGTGSVASLRLSGVLVDSLISGTKCAESGSAPLRGKKKIACIHSSMFSLSFSRISSRFLHWRLSAFRLFLFSLTYLAIFSFFFLRYEGVF